MIDLGGFNPYLQGVYIDLDSIFDTRFAVLEQVDPMLALNALKAGWGSRQTDIFEGLDKKLFDALYASRDTSVLAIAPRTMAMDAVKTWVLKALATIQGSPNGDVVEVFVNIYPYMLSRIQARELGASISTLLGDQVTVHMVNIATDKLCTRTVKRYFSAMFMYDYDIWLESSAKLQYFETMRAPDVTLYAPRLYKTAPPTQEQDRELRNSKTDLFSHFEITAGGYIGLEFIEPSFFSCVLPDDYLDNYQNVKKTAESALSPSVIITV